jgi:hypothetical protein
VVLRGYSLGVRLVIELHPARSTGSNNKRQSLFIFDIISSLGGRLRHNPPPRMLNPFAAHDKYANEMSNDDFSLLTGGGRA